MTATISDPKCNHLLGVIPDTEWTRFAPHLTPVSLGLGDVNYESGKEQPWVLFPTDSIFSLLYVMENGASAEVAIVDNQGQLQVAEQAAGLVGAIIPLSDLSIDRRLPARSPLVCRLEATAWMQEVRPQGWGR
jgi:hypothetical protein